MRGRWFVSVLCISLTLAAHAQTSQPIVRQQTQPHQTTSIGTDLNASEQAHAERWGLDANEYRLYRALMQGPRGSFSVPTISPLEVLGIHAETDAQRRQYAERLVQMLFEDTERVLAFERETQAAWRRLYGGVPMIDSVKLEARDALARERTQAFAGKRLAVFVSTTCASCQQALPGLMKLAAEDGPAAGLDVYVIDTTDQALIRAFARRSGVDPHLVSRRRVTLNQGQALFRQLDGPGVVPQVFYRDGERLVPVPDLTKRGPT